MQDNLVRIIHGDLEVEIDIHLGVHQGVFHAVDVLGHIGLSVSTHDDFVSISVDMTLAKRDGLSKHIIACSKQVNVEDLVVLDETEDALIVVTAALRGVGDNDALGSVRLNHALGHRERKEVALVSEELEGGGKIAVIDNIQKTVGGLLNLNFTKLDCLCGQLNIVAIGHTFAAEFNLISSESRNFKQCEAGDTCHLWGVRYSYFDDLPGAHKTFSVVHLNGKVLTIVIDFLDGVSSGHEGRVLEVEDLASRLADEEVFEVETLSVERHERILADGAHLDDL